MKYTVFMVSTLDHKFIRAGRFQTDTPCSRISAMKPNPALCHVEEIGIYFTIAEADMKVAEIRASHQRKPAAAKPPEVKLVKRTSTECVRRAKVMFA